MPVVVAATGHRPKYLGGHTPRVMGLLRQCATTALIRLRPDKLIVGGALGWDQAVGWAAYDLGIPFDTYVPFIGQELKWPDDSQKEYHQLLELSANVKVICEPGYAGWKMIKRDHAMTDDGDQILALWNKIKDPNSGTWKTLQYLGDPFTKPVHNAWDDWQQLAKGVIF